MSDPRLLKTSLTAIALAVLGGTAGAQTAGPSGTLAPVTVTGSRNSQLGIADSANSGVVTQEQLEARTVGSPRFQCNK